MERFAACLINHHKDIKALPLVDPFLSHGGGFDKQCLVDVIRGDIVVKCLKCEVWHDHWDHTAEIFLKPAFAVDWLDGLCRPHKDRD